MPFGVHSDLDPRSVHFTQVRELPVCKYIDRRRRRDNIIVRTTQADRQSIIDSRHNPNAAYSSTSSTDTTIQCTYFVDNSMQFIASLTSKHRTLGTQTTHDDATRTRRCMIVKIDKSYNFVHRRRTKRAIVRWCLYNCAFHLTQVPV